MEHDPRIDPRPGDELWNDYQRVEVTEVAGERITVRTFALHPDAYVIRRFVQRDLPLDLFRIRAAGCSLSPRT